MNLQEKLRDFEYEEETLDLKEIFPDLNKTDLNKRYHYRGVYRLPHVLLEDLTLKLWEPNGYQEIIRRYGFHDQYKKFEGHCHQITPALGMVLKATGFAHVAYLEGFRVDPGTGEKVPPEEEKSEMREEFCGIGRIPYCCLEVGINGEIFYLSGKHLKQSGDHPVALLTPDCYRNVVPGSIPHQANRKKSVIYLALVADFPGVEEGKPFVWMKQKLDLTTNKPAESKEYFRTYKKFILTL